MAQYPYEVVGLKQFEIVRVDATGLVHQNGVALESRMAIEIANAVLMHQAGRIHTDDFKLF